MKDATDFSTNWWEVLRNVLTISVLSILLLAVFTFGVAACEPKQEKRGPGQPVCVQLEGEETPCPKVWK